MTRKPEPPRGAPFPAWSNSIYRFALWLLGVGAAMVPFFFILIARSPYFTGQDAPVAQPIKFDHRHHVLDDGIACRYCHMGFASSPYAGIPATSVCMNCHAQIWPSSPELARVRDSYFRNEPIHWQRVNSVPGFVFFNHSIHVNKGVGCVTCHGRVDLMPQVYQAEPLTMGWCLHCHRDPAPNLRPPEEVTEMDWKPKGPRLELGRALQAKLDAHPSTDCTGCHR